MGADFSRIRIDPLLDFAGVELKQGGVVLDADFNEMGAVIDRRLRAMASDILGRSTVSSTTPDAFRITDAGGGLQIGQGRLYVDGLLAENHGARSDDAADRRFDPLLAEPAFTDPVPYDAQPYLPAAPALPTAGRHLVYLDVWNREVTHLERPELVEVAVGVESSSRLQTVWQVRVLEPDARTATCASEDDDIAGWSALTSPSRGRLTTGSFEVPPEDDPCELPPSGGFRGRENQTYRVEIHDPGAAGGGGATFKWSRDNASVGSRVASVVSGTELELQSLGRDDVLRFDSGDWVEITDDVREFSQRSGEMRRITVDEAARRITFMPALPAGMLPASFPDSDFPTARNMRARRWDQSRRVLSIAADGTTPVFQDLDAGTSGVIDVPPAGTTLLLEDGVTVEFAVVPPVAGGPPFRAGDHWVFVARTADASVETLDAAPPRGIHHHYERLGIWDVAAGEISDCRHHWPPDRAGHDCTCTQCVSAASHADGSLTIQAAIDRIRDTGGTICLGIGQYPLSDPLQMNGVRAIRIRGQGAATVLVTAGGAFDIGGSMAVTVEDLAILSLGRRSAIVVRTVLGLSLHRLLVAVVANSDFRGAAIALSGVAAGVTIRDNVIFGPIGIRALEPGTGSGDEPPPLQFLLTAMLRVENNLLWCERQGVALSGAVLHLMANRILGNEIVGGRLGAVTVLGLSGPGASMRICDNSLNVTGAGITAGVDGLWIEGNKLLASSDPDNRIAASSAITLSTGLDPNGSNEAQVLANQIGGFDAAGIRIAAPVQQLIVKLNTIRDCGNGIVAEAEARSGNVSIDNNHVTDIGARGPNVGEVVGISVIRADSATVAGNTLRRIGTLSDGALLRAGITATAVLRLRVSGNEVVDIAPPGAFENGLGIGVLVRPPYRQVGINANQIEREAQGSPQQGGRFVAVMVDEPGAERVTSRVGAFAALRVDASSTLVLGATRPFLVRDAVFGAAAVLPPANVSVTANALGASGRLHAVQIETAGDCQFADNRCELRGGRSSSAVRLQAGSTIVNANRVLGGEVSIDIRGDPKRATVLGNITDHGIHLGGPLSSPWDALNVRV